MPLPSADSLPPTAFIGPLKIINRPIGNRGTPGNYAAWCHFENCNWADYNRDLKTVRQTLLRHIKDFHVSPPPPIMIRADQMPGR